MDEWHGRKDRLLTIRGVIHEVGHLFLDGDGVVDFIGDSLLLFDPQKLADGLDPSLEVEELLLVLLGWSLHLKGVEIRPDFLEQFPSLRKWLSRILDVVTQIVEPLPEEVGKIDVIRVLELVIQIFLRILEVKSQHLSQLLEGGQGPLQVQFHVKTIHREGGQLLILP